MATSVPKVISRCYQQLRFQREIPGSETNDKLRMTEEWGDERRVEAGAQPRLKNYGVLHSSLPPCLPLPRPSPPFHFSAGDTLNADVANVYKQ